MKRQKIPWLLLAVFAYFALSCLLRPDAALHTQRLSDSDDTMRLQQVAAWMQGQDWYDLSVARLSPSTHTIVHWSRLIDLPIAALATALKNFYSLNESVFIAALITPLLWLVLFFGVLWASAYLLLQKNKYREESALWIGPWFLVTPTLAFNFTPGRVDHHGVQAIIATFSLLALGHIVTDHKPCLYSIFSALLFACGFWIGAEALPWASLFITALGVSAAWYGKNIARNAALFGLALPIFTTLLIPIALPKSEFFSVALSWFSPAYALFALLAGGILVLGWGLTLNVSSQVARLFIYAFCAVAAALAFCLSIPSALDGPFTDYDTFDATTALDNIREATPLIHGFVWHGWQAQSLFPLLLTSLRMLMLPLMALAACLFASFREQDTRRALWLTYALFLLVAATLTLFWQSRVGVFLGAFTLPPLAWLAGELTGSILKRWEVISPKISLIGFYILLGLFPVILLPAFLTKIPLYPNLIYFPAPSIISPCIDDAMLDALNNRNGLGSHPHIIMNVSDTGPDLIFRTSHSVISGNFNVAGNRDAFDFFRALDDTKALKILNKTGADLVQVCPNAPTLYVGEEYYRLDHAHLKPGKDGTLHLVNTDPQQPLIMRLLRGEPPRWLKPVEILGHSDYLLYRFVESTGQK